MEVGVIGHPGDGAVERVEVAEILEKGSVIIHQPPLVVNSAAVMTVRAIRATYVPVLVRI